MRSGSPRGSLTDEARERFQHMAGDRGYARGARCLDYGVRLLVDTAADSWRHPVSRCSRRTAGSEESGSCPAKRTLPAVAVMLPLARRPGPFGCRDRCSAVRFLNALGYHSSVLNSSGELVGR